MGIWEWLLLLLLLFGGTHQSVSEPIAIRDEGESSIAGITEYGNEFFTEDDGWEVFFTYEGEYGNISVAWVDDENEMVAHVVDYPTENYTEKRIFNVGWVRSSLEPNYDELEFISDCEEDDLYLWEFDIEYRGEPYHALIWMFYLNGSYIRNVLFTFPIERADEMDEYAEQMFPDLYTCED
jgi:hypothetical protein